MCHIKLVSKKYYKHFTIFCQSILNLYQKYKVLLGFVVILSIILYLLVMEFFVIYNRRRDKVMTVSFMNVGQGDAILITTPNFNQVMIDTAMDEIVISRLDENLSYFDKTIDLVISSHAHADHVGGLPFIMNSYNLQNHVSNFGEHDNALVNKVYESGKANKVNHIIQQAGDKIILDEKNNIYIDILWPTEQVLVDGLNDNSIVALLVFDKIKFLVTGDIGKKIENNLVSVFESKIEAEVLKLGHHGSKTSTDYNFLVTVRPEYAVISAGENNQYGHPHQEVLDTLERYKKNYPQLSLNENWIQTTAYDSVVFETNGVDLWLVK